MGPIRIELNPNRNLLDANFDGYKLSLQQVPINKKELSKPVDRVLLSSSQYSLLHTKLYGLHNHLIGDHLDDTDSVYFIDSDWNICKTYIDPFSGDLIEPINLWQVPRKRERKVGDYNITLTFASKSIAVLADGMGTIYILNTGCRNDDDAFTVLFSNEVTDSNEGFVIVSAVSKTTQDQKEELHVLLLNIKQVNEEEKYSTILYWLSFIEDDGRWQQVAMKELRTKGGIEYVAVENDCEALYIVSDSGCKFTVNPDCPAQSDNGVQEAHKIYQWTQNFEEITIKFPQSENVNKELVNVMPTSTDIDIKYNENQLLKGPLHHRIDPDLTTWTITNNYLEVVLNKSEPGLMWPELVKGDQTGEYVLNTSIIEEVHERLGHLCSDSEATPLGGTTFNSQQVEECDFEADKETVFERLSPKTNNVTHKIHLGSHQVLLTAKLSTDLPPALGIKHDVDVCLWQPQWSDGNFSVSHEGTLLAFGYVQASKQNRKFSLCPPDMSYSVICESSGHLFIYRQKKPISSGELRNRTSSARIHTIAEQQVINISNNEVIGIYATNKILYLLCENSLRALKL